MSKKSLAVVVAVVFSAVLLAFALASPAQDGSVRDEDGTGLPSGLVKRGLAIAPVHLTYKKKDKDLVGYGSYLVNAVGGCNDCHTSPPYADGGNPYQGQPEQINTTNYLAGGQQFGPFVSRNITPDATTGLPANLTLDEFINVMRTGADPDNQGQLLQVMPWPTYGKMTDKDLKAIYAYLSAIPHADPPTG